jgi:hypothetical protein
MKVHLFLAFFFCALSTELMAQCNWICPDSANQATWASNQVRVTTDTNVSCEVDHHCIAANQRCAKITIEVPPDTCCRCKISWVEIHDKINLTKFKICHATPSPGFCSDEDWMLANLENHIALAQNLHYPANKDTCESSFSKLLYPYYCNCPNLQECMLMNRCANDFHPRKLEIVICWDRTNDYDIIPGDHSTKGHDFYLKIYIDCSNKNVWDQNECRIASHPVVSCPGPLPYPDAIRIRF